MQFQLNITKNGVNGKYGLAAVSQGAPAVMSGGQFADGLFSEVSPRFYNLVASGLVYGVQYASGATAAASATAAGAFSLFNPPSSGVNLVMIDIVTALNSFTAATSNLVCGIQLAGTQTPTTVTPGNTPVNLCSGSTNTAQAKTYTVATMVGAPTTVGRILSGWYFDLAAGDITTTVKDQIDGGIIVAPGSMLNIVSVANTPTILAHMTWAEIPV